MAVSLPSPTVMVSPMISPYPSFVFPPQDSFEERPSPCDVTMLSGICFRGHRGAPHRTVVLLGPVRELLRREPSGGWRLSGPFPLRAG